MAEAQVIARRHIVAGLRARVEVREAVPVIALIIMAAATVILQPRVMSYFGLTLLLRYSEPLLFVTMAQLCILVAGDIDLGIGSFVSLVNCIVSTLLTGHPLFCILALAGCVACYALMGAIVQLRRLPSIVVTLGFSFVWLGLALLILPSPGGDVPDWLSGALSYRAPILPMPIIVAVALGLLGHWLLRSSYGTLLKGLGSNPQAIENAGHSLLRGRAVLYAAAGMCGVLGGLALSGLNTTGDPWVGTQYTLLSIAGAIIGGAEFSGGVVSPIGAIFGAIIMLLSSSLLSFLNISTDWQLSVQGGLLVLVLALRVLLQWGGR
jgi:ribose/xylose/arabinose/galactoside ABC-type transport system permease subunit